MSLRRWIDDWRWALQMRKVRALRRDMTFSTRHCFDDELRRPIDGIESALRIAYPDAIYHARSADFRRAAQLLGR